MGPIAVASAILSTNLYPIFPASRLGNIKTFALPATSLSGAFRLPTSSTSAASSCISPSTAISGHLSLTACATFSVSAVFALPFVENESIATTASTPIIFLQLSAVLSAISASIGASGFGLTALSANKRMPFFPNFSFFVTIMK